MRYRLVLLPMVAAGCAGTYPYGYTYRGDQSYGPAYEQYYGARYADGEYTGRYNGAYTHNIGSGYYGGENCGTPDEPKACPPLPRRPLSYYPGDR
jgi:hypothetical protein